MINIYNKVYLNLLIPDQVHQDSIYSGIKENKMLKISFYLFDISSLIDQGLIEYCQSNIWTWDSKFESIGRVIGVKIICLRKNLH